MPAEYEAIRDKFIAQGLSEKSAKKHAAMIFDSKQKSNPASWQVVGVSFELLGRLPMPGGWFPGRTICELDGIATDFLNIPLDKVPFRQLVRHRRAFLVGRDAIWVLPLSVSRHRLDENFEVIDFHPHQLA